MQRAVIASNSFVSDYAHTWHMEQNTRNVSLFGLLREAKVT